MDSRLRGNDNNASVLITITLAIGGEHLCESKVSMDSRQPGDNNNASVLITITLAIGGDHLCEIQSLYGFPPDRG